MAIDDAQAKAELASVDVAAILGRVGAVGRVASLIFLLVLPHSGPSKRCPLQAAASSCAISSAVQAQPLAFRSSSSWLLASGQSSSSSGRFLSATLRSAL